MKKILLLLILSVSLSGFSQVVVEIEGPITWPGFNFNNLFPNSSLTGTLTSVQIEGTLTNSVSDTFASDLTFYVSQTDVLAASGLVQIGGFSNLQAAERRTWGCEPTCDSSVSGTLVSGTVILDTPIDFTGSTYNAWLGNGYGAAGTSGTFTNITITLTGVEEVPDPTARFQVIHNSPDAAAAEVDVYVNGILFIDDFAFRTNTNFVTAPAGVPLNIQIAPGNSESADDAIFSQEFTLDADQTYILIANGIVSTEGYSSGPNFGLSVFAGGREEASDPEQTDILVNHGSPDAPAVDVVETSLPAGIIVDNIAFPEFNSYLELPTLDFVLDVRPTGTSTTVASFLAPLQTLELEGTAITVIASGFLDPSQNSDGPAFGLFVAGATAGELIPLPLAPTSATARLQVIHNSPDAAAAVVDVYVNGDLFIDDFAFRTASPFETVPAGVELNIAIAPGSSTSAAESVFNTTVTLDENQTYIVIANGIVSAEGYSSGPNFGLSVFAGGREEASDSEQTDILVNHGSPDAPAVDVVETSLPAGIIVDNIAFPEFNSYLELPTLDFVLDVRPTGTSTTVASFLAPLQSLELEGTAITVIASGFLDPSQNSDGPAFGLWVATAAGGALIPLPVAPTSATARLQVIHNSPDAAAAVVDVYVNGDLFIDDFAFRTASPFETVPAGVELNIAIAPGSSTSAAESVFNTTVTLDENQTYIVIANGIVSAEGYSSGPNFGLSVFAGGREEATDPEQTDILVNHGSPDAPAVDVVETSLPAGIIVDNIAFPEFDGYLELPTLDFVLDVRPTGTSTTVASFLAPLQTLELEGTAITVIASGFLDPSQNSDGPAFGLWVATAAGGALIPLPTNDLSINGSNKAVFTTYPNPVKDILYLEFPEVVDQFSAKVVDLSGRIISTTNTYINGIDVSELASGMYMLEVNADGASNAIKFVKK